MTADLEALRAEIEDFLASAEFAVFHSSGHHSDPLPVLYWDCERYPDYKDFLALAKKVDVKLIVFSRRQLEPDFIDDALDQLESADLPEDEYTELGRRLRELRVFEGFTSSVELSFEYQGRVYMYSRRAEWYEELLDIADEIADYAEEEEDFEEPDEEDMGPYFSKN